MREAGQSGDGSWAMARDYKLEAIQKSCGKVCDGVAGRGMIKEK